MMSNQPRLAILHTTPVTIASLTALCSRLLPGVKVNHYLDDSILQQINAEGCISAGVRYRFQSLIALAAASKPDVILSACSSVGGMLEEAREMFGIPLVRIDEPMARNAAAKKSSIVVCATVKSTLEPTLALIRRFADPGIEVESLLIAEAGKLLATGDKEAYLSLIASRLTEAAEKSETVVLAQASMAEAVQRMPEALQSRFLTSPEAGIAALSAYFA